MNKVQTIVIPTHGIRAVPRRNIRGDFPFGHNTRVSEGQEYSCTFNPQSAVSVIAENGETLGLKPGEFDFVCPWFKHSETVLPREDHDKPGHCWRVVPVGDGGHIEVNREKRAILRVFVGVNGWLVEHAALEESCPSL